MFGRIRLAEEVQDNLAVDESTAGVVELRLVVMSVSSQAETTRSQP